MVTGVITGDVLTVAWLINYLFIKIDFKNEYIYIKMYEYYINHNEQKRTRRPR